MKTKKMHVSACMQSKDQYGNGGFWHTFCLQVFWNENCLHVSGTEIACRKALSADNESESQFQNGVSFVEIESRFQNCTRWVKIRTHKPFVYKGLCVSWVFSHSEMGVFTYTSKKLAKSKENKHFSRTSVCAFSCVFSYTCEFVEKIVCF